MPSSTSSSDNGGAAAPRRDLGAGDYAQPVAGAHYWGDDTPVRAIPAQPWLFAMLLALALFAVGLGVWEWQVRERGLSPGDLGDSDAQWAIERRKLQAGDPDAVAIVGDSRLLFDTDLSVWERKTGIRPVQLALPGTGARPFITDLADDPTFRGLAVVGVAEFPFFNPGEGLRGRFLEYYREETPAQRSGHLLGQWLERRFAFLDSDYRFWTIIERQQWLAERPGVEPKYWDVWKLSTTAEDRETRLWSRVEQDAAYRDKTQQTWVRTERGPMPPPLVDKLIAQTVADVARIRARGGEVVFVRPPSAGEVLERERRSRPRHGYWDPLIARTGSLGVHVDDHPTLQGFDVPEWSHVSIAHTPLFTAAYVDILVRDLPWLAQRVERREAPDR